MENKNNKDGYFTVEAVFIVVVMLFSIMAVMYSFMLIYQYALVQHAATTAAEHGAQMVSSAVEGKSVYSLYTRPTASDISEIENIAKKELNRSILSQENCSVTADKVQLEFLWSTGIRVTVKQNIKIPIVGILNDFGITNIGNFESVAVAEISNPQETIRNIDLGMDVTKQGISLIKDTITNLFKFGMAK